MTGMPGWGNPEDGDHDQKPRCWSPSSDICRSLAAEEGKAMEKFNPKSPAEREEEQTEEDFLNGKTPKYA
jgi:hypothetical protein